NPGVLMIPSAYRGADDYCRLAMDLAAACISSAALNLHGIGRSSGTLDGHDLREIADDIATLIGAVSPGAMHLVGHALGNILARATAAYHPEVVRSVTLLACGGHELTSQPPPSAILEHLQR